MGGSYGVIGNHWSSALISLHGSIDWCCFPYLDSPSVFNAYTDSKHGGRFLIQPSERFESHQRYLPDSLILETQFQTLHGKGVLVDWMPLGTTPSENPSICRRVIVTEGSIPWTLQCSPRFHYGISLSHAERSAQGILFRGMHPEELLTLQSDLKLEISSHPTTASTFFTLRSGESAEFLLTWGRRVSQTPLAAHQKTPFPELSSTQEYWRKIAHHCPQEGCLFAGPWHDLVSQSGLLLHLLSTSYSGSIVQGVATLIQAPHFSRVSWDTRFASIRNGIFILKALTHLNYDDLARSYFSWVRALLERDPVELLQSNYSLDGSRNLPERFNPLTTYAEHHESFQLDIFGQIILCVSEYFHNYGDFPPEIWPRLTEVGDYLSQVWRRPDWSLESSSGRAEHSVFSKLFCWAALDQICDLGSRQKKEIPHRWLQEKQNLFQIICEQGFDPQQNSFTQSFESSQLHSSVLWLILLNFLPPDDARIQGTLLTLESHLSTGVFIKTTHEEGSLLQEPPFHLTNSLHWIIVLALTGRSKDAMSHLAELITYSNPLGLFGNELHLNSETPPRRFPCTEVHVLLILAALAIGEKRMKSVSSFPFTKRFEK